MGNALDDINVGNSALPLAHALRLKTIPVSRVENMCATGSEALRAAVYAVAAGAVDFALALGVEKLKDTGYGGLPLRTKGLANDLWLPYGSAPGSFAQLAGAYAAKHRLNGDDLKRAMAHVSWKSHQNAVSNPRAHLRKAVDIETILKAPMIADPLGLYRLLRRLRRRGLRHRDDARHRRGTRDRQSRDRQGRAALGEPRLGDAISAPGTAAYVAEHAARRRAALMRKPASKTLAPSCR